MQGLWSKRRHGRPKRMRHDDDDDVAEHLTDVPRNSKSSILSKRRHGRPKRTLCHDDDDYVPENLHDVARNSESSISSNDNDDDDDVMDNQPSASPSCERLPGLFLHLSRDMPSIACIQATSTSFNCNGINDNQLTADKVLNSVIYGSPFCVIIYTSYKRLKTVRFLAHPLQ